MEAEYRSSAAAVAARAAAVLAAGAGFATLYLAAWRLTGNMGLAGLSDQAVRGIAHFGVYGTLAVLLAKALGDWKLLAWLLAVVLASVEEFRQLFIPYRFGCLRDWATNVAGITVFLLIAHLAGPHATARLERLARTLSARAAEWMTPRERILTRPGRDGPAV